jgi:hypothetical protein
MAVDDVAMICGEPRACAVNMADRVPVGTVFRASAHPDVSPTNPLGCHRRRVRRWLMTAASPSRPVTRWSAAGSGGCRRTRWACDRRALRRLGAHPHHRHEPRDHHRLPGVMKRARRKPCPERSRGNPRPLYVPDHFVKLHKPASSARFRGLRQTAPAFTPASEPAQQPAM